MKHNLKLMSICITVLMILCIHFTAMADSVITYYGVIDGLTSNPDTPKVGDTLVYFSSITTGVTDLVGDFPETIIGCRVTYSLVPAPTAPGAIIRWKRVSHGSNVELEGNALKGTFTFTVSEPNPKPLLGIFDDFTVEGVGVGTGEIRMTGTVTTTRGTFNIKIEEPLFITIHPALPEPDGPAPPAELLPAPEPAPEPAPIPAEVAAAAAARLATLAEVVSIPDANLAAAVRKALGLTPNARITYRATEKLRNLNFDDRGITNTAGLEYATQLEMLFLGRNQINNYNPLAQLPKLTRLHLWANGISDLSVLPPMPQLEFLDLNWNQIDDLSPLAGFTNLKELWLQGNKLTDTSTLFQLHNGTFPPDEEVKVTQEQDNRGRAYTLLTFQSLDLKVRINPDVTVYRSLNALQNALQTVATTNVLVEASERPPMYWIDAKTGTLHRLIKDEVENLLPNVQNVTSLVVDTSGSKLYWTAQNAKNAGTINTANLDGTNPQILRTLRSVPRGIALDSTNGKLYLTNSQHRLQRINLDGTGFEYDFILNVDAPMNIAVSSSSVYWTETTEGFGRIRRANLDGSSVQNLVTNLTEPLPLAVINGKLYWTNGTRENKGELQRADLNGFNREVLQTLPIAPTGIAVDPARRLLYLTLPSGEIHRRNLDGSEYQPVVTGLVSPSNIVLGISATPPVLKDTTVPPSTPVVDADTDVNQDKKVNKTDLLLVVTALGESPPANPNFDVNADGTVNIADVLLVIEALDDPVAAAAPSFGETGTSLDPGRLAMQIDILRTESDGSMQYEQAIAFFQSLLASSRPTETRLLANYPNPFNPETWIPYQLADSSNVQILIYDTKGTVVRHLELGHQPAGYYTNRSRAAYWDGRNALGERVASGIYFYQLQANNVSSLRKMLILK